MCTGTLNFLLMHPFHLKLKGHVPLIRYIIHESAVIINGRTDIKIAYVGFDGNIDEVKNALNSCSNVNANATIFRQYITDRYTDILLRFVHGTSTKHKIYTDTVTINNIRT